MVLGFGIVQGLANIFCIEPDSKKILGFVGQEVKLKVLCKYKREQISTNFFLVKFKTLWTLNFESHMKYYISFDFFWWLRCKNHF